MITSFFAPKSKTGKKRAVEDERGDESNTSRTKRRDERVVTPPSQSSSASDATSRRPLSDEATALLSLLCEEEGRAHVPDWRSALEVHFASSGFSSLAKFVARERASHTVYPPPRSVFSALNLTPLHRVKVVIVGQDPYHQPNQGHGLSFSVPAGVAIPPSLRNIYKELLNDPNVTEFDSLPRHGNLERWARQGVLLLNNVLTVRRGEAASHAKRGWEEFTDGIIEAVVRRDADIGAMMTRDRPGAGVVFLLWGKPASLKATTVLAKFNNGGRAGNVVITCSHPSPLGATKTSSPFMGSRCFSRANEELVRRGRKPIDWRVDGPLEYGVEKSPIMEEVESTYSMGATEDFDV